MKEHNRRPNYASNSLTLVGAVSLGTGVMIGAGIFALTGQMAEMTGALFPLAFIAAAVVVSFSSYSYVKMSNAFPSAAGIGMFLQKAYGNSVTTAFNALLMYCSMVIAQSFLARTFGAYTAQLFDIPDTSYWVSILGVGLIAAAFAINLSGNKLIERVASILGIFKILGIAVFAIVGIWLARNVEMTITKDIGEASLSGFLGATALGILAFKGFTTITNSGSEVKNPQKNVGRAIIISISICIVLYILVGFAVSSNLSLSDIIETKNYSLAAAARPALGDAGVWFTAILAMVATAGGIIASIFAVSRMLAMLTDMKLVPHSHFGMPGSIQKHTLVYTVVLALILTAFFDLTRIAALGIIFYLVMDIAIHWGLLKHLKEQILIKPVIPMMAILLDLILLVAFILVKIQSDWIVLAVAGVVMLAIWITEKLFLAKYRSSSKTTHNEHHEHH